MVNHPYFLMMTGVMILMPGMDEGAVVERIEYQSDEPALYLPFMKAITAV